MARSLLNMKRVYFSYGSGHYVLRDVSLDINRREIIGIAGPNGAGKTTLLKIMVGLLKPSKGTVRILGKDLGSGGRRLIGYLPQEVNRADRNFPATVEEVVGTGLYGRIGVFGRASEQDRVKVRNAIRGVGLAGLGRARVSELSGGQLQKAMIARALVSNPSLLILDEPTAAVDLAGEERFYRLLGRINKEYGVAVVLVSHDVYSLLDHTNRLIFINERVLYDGRPQEMSSQRLLRLLFSHEHSRSLVKRLGFEIEARRAG